MEKGEWGRERKSTEKEGEWGRGRVRKGKGNGEYKEGDWEFFTSPTPSPFYACNTA